MKNTEPTEFEIKLCEAIQNAGATKGAGATAEEMFDLMELERTEENVRKLTEALRKLQKMQYVYKIEIAENISPEWFTTQAYWQQRETYWMGPKFGRKPIRVDVPSDNPPVPY